MKKRFAVTYRIQAKNNSDARDKAEKICIEQTVEFPPAHIKDKYILNNIIGKIESIRPAGKGSYVTVITYADESGGGEVTQLLNVLLGNSSIIPGIRIENISLSPSLLIKYKGPRFGIAGIRKILGVYNRPLLCSAIKPMGTSAKRLAKLAGKFALGGLDMIKDDHGLADQEFSPFKERVSRVCKAVRRSEKIAGTRCLYAPNITADGGETLKRARFAKKAGAGALVISPALCGFGTVKEIADDPSIGLPILMHPAFMGAFTTSCQSGISHAALYGTIARLCGADATIFPNFGGRFSFSKEECASIAVSARDKHGRLKPIFPAPGGGMQLETVKQMVDFYGKDVLFLMGGGLFSAGPVIYAEDLSYSRDAETRAFVFY